ncbi:MAG: AAA family ATPase, partial [Planctomycetota bacterium]|nr:AAA family ATPase [Planctomycetota bacterium]
MRRIAIINQKGGVGKTTTAANLGSALARLGRRVVVVDLDAQANLSLHLGTDLASGEPSTYDLLLGRESFAGCLKETTTAGLRLLPAHIDLSGAEIELASAFGREILLREAIDTWEAAGKEAAGETPADYVILDCPPSLGLLSINGLAAAHEVIVTLQTEFFALQGISKLVEIVQLMRRRINPNLNVAGILPTLYDTRLKLAREVLAEIRRYFPGQVFSRPIRTNIKLAEAPSHGV